MTAIHIEHRRPRMCRTAVAAGVLVLIAGLWTWAGQNPAAAEVLGVPSDQPLPLQTPQLLSDSGFQNGTGPWHASPGEDWAIYSGSSAEDQDYLETNTGTGGAGGSVYQDVSTTPQVGHSYVASLFMRSPSATPVSVSLALWALGATTEMAQTDVTVSSADWTRYSVELDVANPGHNDLRFQVYVDTAGPNVDLDGATLQDAGLGDPGFQSGFGPWQATPGENWAIYSGSSAEDQDYLETNSGTGGAGGGVYQDVSATPLAGDSYQASLFMRSPSGTPLSVSVVLWALGGSSEMAQSDVTVSSTSWTNYSVELDVGDSDDDDLRFQVYLETGGPNLDLDGATLEDAGVSDSGFQSGMGPWQTTPGQNWAVYSGSSAEDQHYLDTNTGTGGAGGSIYQDVSITPLSGYSYVASLFMRSPSATPVSVALALWALGGSNEVAQTDVTVSSTTWTDYSVELDVANSDDDDLRLQVYVDTGGPNLDLDGAVLDEGGTYSTLTALRSSIVAAAEAQDQYQNATIASPIGSDCNIFTGYFGEGSTTGTNGDPCPAGTRAEDWCSDFADWAWTIVGDEPSGVTGWAFTWINWGEDNGTFKAGATDDPEPGDVVVWGSMSQQYAQHVGIVVGVAYGMINIVSGNSGPENAQGDVYSVWESGYLNPATSTVYGYPIVGYVAPDGFDGS